MKDALLCAWFALVSVAFWGPFVGLALPANVLIALYAAFLVSMIAVTALRLVKETAEEPGQPEANSGPRTEGGTGRGR